MINTPLNSLRTGLILFSICLLIFLINIDYTAVNLALIPISQEISVDLNSLQWLLSGYVLVWGAFVIPAGRLADLYGKRRILMIGVLIFLVGSVVTGVGNSIGVLIFGRILQGIGAAVFSPPCFGLIFSLIPPERQGVSIGLVGGMGGLGLAAGPTLAGVILDLMTWRWIFFINIPMGFLVMAVISKFVPKDSTVPDSKPIDKWGALFLLGGLVALMVGLNHIEKSGLQNFFVWFLLGTGASILFLFHHRNKNIDPQILPLSLLKNHSFMGTVYSIFLNCFCFSLILLLMGIFIQQVLRYSSYETGLIFLSMTLTIGILSPVGGRLADRIDARLLIFFSFICLGLTTFLMSLLPQDASLTALIPCLFIAGLGLGFGFPCLNTIMFRTVEPVQINTASGLFTMAAMLGNTVGVILSTGFLGIISRFYLLNFEGLQNLKLNEVQYDRLLNQLKALPTGQYTTDFILPKSTDSLLYKAFMQGISWNLRVGTLVCLVALLVVYTQIKKQPRIEKRTESSPIPIL